MAVQGHPRSSKVYPFWRRRSGWTLKSTTTGLVTKIWMITLLYSENRMLMYWNRFDVIHASDCSTDGQSIAESHDALRTSRNVKKSLKYCFVSVQRHQACSCSCDVLFSDNVLIMKAWPPTLARIPPSRHTPSESDVDRVLIWSCFHASIAPFDGGLYWQLN